MQTHDGRCAAVDIDRLEAVSEKTLQSIFDLSMVVWMAMGETTSRRSCRIAALSLTLRESGGMMNCWQCGESKGQGLTKGGVLLLLLTIARA